MVSLNNITDALESFGDGHPMVQRYTIGMPSELDATKNTSYPLMHVVYEGATYSTGIKTYSFSVVFIGRVSELNATSEAIRLVSDLEQIAEDLVADITTGHVYFQIDESYETSNASVRPLFDSERNIASGCVLSLAIDVPFAHNACIAPV